MSQPIVIRISFALVFVVVLHAVITGLLFQRNVASPDRDPWPLKPHRPMGEIIDGLQIESLPQPPVVNYSAQGELKQAGRPCVNCIPANQGERIVHVGPWRTVAPVATPARPYHDPLPNTVPQNLTVTNVSNAVPTQQAKKYQVSLFIDGSAKGQEIANWFKTDPNLIRLREQSDFQIFTSANPLYRTRYAAIVPVDQFPVILLTDATGGHIHAAGSTMIPATAAELWEDFRVGATLYKQSKSGEVVTGAIKTRGYSWDNAINPAMQLNSEDCPDGYCPTPDTGWRPFDRVRPDRDGGGLFDDVMPDAKNLLTWASPIDLATLGVFGIAFVLILALLFRRSAN